VSFDRKTRPRFDRDISPVTIRHVRRPPAPGPDSTHIAAEHTWVADGVARHAQLRILGDDERGYLLMGAFDLLDDEPEFWFATLDEAKAQSTRIGVPLDAWSEITSRTQIDPGR
jgi:hypothetical protein